MTLRTRLVLGSLLTLALSLGAALYWIDRSTRLAFEQQFDAEVSRARAAVAARLRRDAEGLRGRLEALARDERIRHVVAGGAPAEAEQLLDVEALLASTALDTLWVLRRGGDARWTVLVSAHAAAALAPKAVQALVTGDSGYAVITETVRRGGRLVEAPVIAVSLRRGDVAVVAGRVLGKELAANLRLGATLPIEIGICDADATGAAARWVSATFDGEPPAGLRRVDIDLDGPAGGSLTAAVFVSDAPLRERLAVVRQAGTVAAALAALLAIALGALMAHRLLRPLRALAEAARAIALGERRVDLKPRRDEIGQVNTAFVAMAADLDASDQRLRQAERIAAWQEIARELAHEIKNPLTPIQMAIETLQRTRTRKPERFDEVFTEATATVLEEVERLKNIVSEFSQFARLPASDLRPGSLNDVVRRAAQLQAESCPGTVTVALDPAVDPVRLDPERMAQVVHNLVKNAIEATSEVETPIIAVRTRVANDREVWLEVSDNGAGLNEADRTKIFAPYFTKRPGGTGLGLAVVSRIVAEHNGSIAVESARGHGTTFTLRLPRLVRR